MPDISLSKLETGRKGQVPRRHDLHLSLGDTLRILVALAGQDSEIDVVHCQGGCQQQLGPQSATNQTAAALAIDSKSHHDFVVRTVAMSGLVADADQHDVFGGTLSVRRDGDRGGKGGLSHFGWRILRRW